MTTRRCRVLAVSALKGGVGKTTTAVNLAAAAARAGRRTLLVDADPQGGVGMSLGLAPETRGLAAWVTKDASFDDSVVRAARENLDVLPAGERLLDVEDVFREKGKEKRRTRLERRFETLGEEAYEVVILDCPPAASLLLENVYHVADELILPAKLDFLSLPALEKTRLFVKEENASREKPLRIVGVLPTFYDLRTAVSTELLDTLRERFTKILTPIRINVALAEAVSPGATGSVSFAHVSLIASFARVPKRAITGCAASRARRSVVTVAGSGTSTAIVRPTASRSEAKSRTSTFTPRSYAGPSRP